MPRKKGELEGGRRNKEELRDTIVPLQSSTILEECRVTNHQSDFAKLYRLTTLGTICAGTQRGFSIVQRKYIA